MTGIVEELLRKATLTTADLSVKSEEQAGALCPECGARVGSRHRKGCSLAKAN